MPRIPTYDTPQVDARALPGARQSSIASPSLFGAAAEQQVTLGKGLLNAGGQLSEVANRMQDRENADMLFRAETALKDEYLKFESDVRQRKGQNAWGATQDAEKWFSDQEKKHAEILENDVQRKLFGQSLTKLRQSALGSISQHEAAERQRSLEESSRSSIATTISLAAAQAAEGFSDSKTNTGPVQKTLDENGNQVATAPSVDVGYNPLAGYKSDILKRVQVLANLNGWGEERRAAEEQMHLTNFHKQVIQNLVDRSPGEARKYFEANKEEINGAEYDAINRMTKISEAKQAGFEFAERPDIRGLATDQDRITAARDFYKDDPEKREAAIAEIKTRSNEYSAMRERGQRDAADTAWGIYARTGKLDDVPASVLANMDGKAYASLKEHAAAKAAGKGTVTDPSTYYDLRQMAAGDPEGFRKLDLRNYLPKLSSSDFEEMVKLQTADAGKAKEVATLTQQLSNTHDLLKWGSSDKAKKGAFDKAVTDAINLEQQRTGKSLGYSERQAVIDRLLIDGDVNGGWLGGGRRLFEVQGTPEAAKFVPKVPDADRQAIVDRFQKRTGRVPTDAEILQTFKAWKGL